MQINESLFHAATAGALEATKFLLAQGAEVNSIHKISDVEVTPLYMAAQNGHVEVVKLLLDNSAEVDARLNTDGATALYIATLNGHAEIVKLLLERGSNTEIAIFGNDSENHHTPLYVAAFKQDMEIVKLLLEKDARVYSDDYVTSLQISLQMRALSQGDEIYQLLLQSYFKELTKNKIIAPDGVKSYSNDKTAFEVVVVRYNENKDDVISWIKLEFPNDKVTIYNKGDDSFLELPINCREIKIANVGYLGGSYLYHIVNNYDHLADRTLFLQAHPYDAFIFLPLSRYREGDLSYCKNIIGHCIHADIKLIDMHNELRNYDWQNLMQGKYKNFNYEQNSLLSFAKKFISNELPETTRVCLGAEFAVDAEKIKNHDIKYYQAMLETMNSKFPIEDFYLERLWDIIFRKSELEISLKPELISNFDDNNLFVASVKGEVDTVKNLLAQGADVEYIDPNTRANSLHMAVNNGHIEVVRLLLENGANPEVKASNQLTALCIAVQQQHTDIVDLLIKHKADIECIFPSGATSLYAAAYLGDKAIVSLLLKAGANTNVIVEGLSIAQIAARRGHVEIVQLLVMDLFNHQLFYAALNGDSIIVDSLLKAGANKEFTIDGKTPLYAAAYNRHFEAVKILLDSGAIIQSDVRFTPLYIAGALHPEIYKLMLSYYFEAIEKARQNILTSSLMEQDSNKFEVVVVRYSENKDDLALWLAKEFPSEKVTVYNKGEDDLDLPSNCQEVKIPNVGYLGGTYLYHIVHNYNYLADRVLFLQASPHYHEVFLPFERYKGDLNSTCSNIIAKCTQTTLGNASNALKQTDWTNSRYKHFTLKDDDLIEYANKFVGSYQPQQSISVCWGAEFAVDAEKIRNHNIEYYQAMLETMDTRFPIEDFYLERLWDLIF